MTEQYTDETKLELLTGASNPDETFNNDMEEINRGLSYEGTLDETGTDGEWFRFNTSGVLVKAQADSATNALVAGILTLSGVQFDERNVRYIGKLEKTSWGLTPNSLYYLDPTTPGAMTTSKPSSPNIVVELGRSDDTGDKFRIRIKVYLETTPGSQPVYETVAGDTGSTTASATDDTLNIVGGVGGIDVAVTPDTATINGPNTLGELNTALGATTIDESTDPRDPNAHNTSHQNGGGDEIGVGGLSGLLADSQTPLGHGSSHEDGGTDEVTAENLPTAEVDTSKVLKPDGAGGIGWQAGTTAQKFWNVLIGSGGDYANLTAYYAASPAVGDQIAMEPGTYVETSPITTLAGQKIFALAIPFSTTAANWPVRIQMGSNAFTPGDGFGMQGVALEYQGVGAGVYLGVISYPCSFENVRFQHTGTTQGRIFDVAGDDVIFDNCIFDGNGYIVFGFNIRGDRCIMKAPKFYNMVASNYSIGKHIEFASSNGSIITDGYFEELGTGANQRFCIIESGTGTGNFYQNITIFANTTTPKRVTGLYTTYDGSAIDGIRVEGCEFGIYLSSAVGARVSNFQAYNCAEFGIYVNTNSNGSSIVNGYCDTCGTSGDNFTGGVFNRANSVHIANVHVVNTPASLSRDFYLYTGVDDVVVNCTGTGEFYVHQHQKQITNCRFAELAMAASANNVRFDGCDFATVSSVGTYTIFDGVYTPSGDTDPTTSENSADGFRDGDTWNNDTGGKVYYLQDASAGTWVLIYPSAISAHASTHEDGGGDEIGVGGLSGLLADGQTPLSHASSHQDTGGDEISVAGLSGLLADGQTPLAHATSHKNGGTDELLLNELGEPTGTIDVNDQRVSNFGLQVYNQKSVTISGGLFTYGDDASVYLVSGEGAAADDLNGISSVPAGAVVILGYAGETITIKNLAAAGGVEFHTNSGGDLVIGDNGDAYAFQNIGGELVEIGNAASGGGAGSDTTAIHDDTAGEIVAITEKTDPVGADEAIIEDSESANAKKSLKLENIPALPQLRNLMKNGTFQDWVDTSVISGVTNQEHATEWGIISTTASMGQATRQGAGAVIGDYVLRMTKLTGTGSDFQVSQSFSQINAGARLEGMTAYFIVSISAYQATTGSWFIEIDPGSVTTTITGTGLFVAKVALSGSTIVARIWGDSSLTNGDDLDIDWAMLVLVDESNGPALNLDTIGYIPGDWDTGGTQYREGAYTGNSGAARMIETGIDFDELWIFVTTTENFPPSNDVGAVHHMFNSNDENISIRLESAPASSRGVSENIMNNVLTYQPVKSGTQFNAGPVGNNIKGFNYSGQTYRWVAKRHARSEGI